eukprot:scaffold501_cov355-Pinguiococcus_pyrenoidosus.AAC.16
MDPSDHSGWRGTGHEKHGLVPRRIDGLRGVVALRSTAPEAHDSHVLVASPEREDVPVPQPAVTTRGRPSGKRGGRPPALPHAATTTTTTMAASIPASSD